MNTITVADEAMDFRRGVDYIGVTVNFVVHDGKGNILLQKRSANCRDEQGMWDVGGGALEFGERLEDAVRREVFEELNTEAKDVKFLKAYEALRDNNGVATHWMAFTHTVLVDPSSVSIGEPHKIDEIGWFNSTNLPSPLHSQFHQSYDTAFVLGLLK